MRNAVFFALLVLTGCKSGQVSREAQTTVPVTVPAELPSPPLRFTAIGTEPFWAIKVDGRNLTYSTPEMPDGVIAEATQAFRGNASESRSGQQTFLWTGRFDRKDFRLEIEKGECNDGMSDIVYSHSARLTLDGRTERGCARMP